MKLLIPILFFALSACASNDKENPYPIATFCQGLPLSEFQDALMSYYQPCDRGVFKICQEDEFFCDNFYQLEQWVKDRVTDDSRQPNCI